MEEKTVCFMYFCKNWGSEECYPEVRKWKFMDGLRENEEVVLKPVKEEVDEICSNCEARKVK